MLALILMCFVVFASCGDDEPQSDRYRSEVFTEVTVSRNVQYGDSPQHVLDLYAPAGDAVARRPALIWMHGGGFAAGNRTEGPLVTFPTSFARLGYVTVSIDYRLLASEPCIGDALGSDTCTAASAAATEDAQTAVRWLRANAAAYGIDSDRLAIAGESAGAIAATGVGIESTSPDESVRAWVSISGGVEDTRAVDRNDAPGCLISGTADQYVPYQRSVDTAAAMRAAGVPVLLETLEGAGHVPVEPHGESLLARSRDFLYDKLDLTGAAT